MGPARHPAQSLRSRRASLQCRLGWRERDRRRSGSAKQELGLGEGCGVAAWTGYPNISSSSSRSPILASFHHRRPFSVNFQADACSISLRLTESSRIDSSIFSPSSVIRQTRSRELPSTSPFFRQKTHSARMYVHQLGRVSVGKGFRSDALRTSRRIVASSSRRPAVSSFRPCRFKTSNVGPANNSCARWPIDFLLLFTVSYSQSGSRRDAEFRRWNLEIANRALRPF